MVNVFKKLHVFKNLWKTQNEVHKQIHLTSGEDFSKSDFTELSFGLLLELGSESNQSETIVQFNKNQDSISIEGGMVKATVGGESKILQVALDDNSRQQLRRVLSLS